MDQSKVKKDVWETVQALNRLWTVENRADDLVNYFHRDMVAITPTDRLRRDGGTACVAYKNSSGGYVDISWNEMNEMVRNLGCFLISQGIKPGDKVALFSPNRYEWWVADLAILSIGAVNVPIYATNSADEDWCDSASASPAVAALSSWFVTGTTGHPVFVEESGTSVTQPENAIIPSRSRPAETAFTPNS